jgi:hypothetical protein
VNVVRIRYQRTRDLHEHGESARRALLRGDVAEMLTRNELSAEAPQNAYSAVQRLRPFFIAAPSGYADEHGRLPRVHVFIDGYMAGDVDILKAIPVSAIESIRRVRPTIASASMGTIRAGDSVVMVQLR